MLRTLGSRTGDHYPLVDSLGSVVALTNYQGALVSRYRYEPYGEQLGSPSGPPMPWRFAGQHLDQETGLYKMGLRYYDPQTMRWTQKDPLNLFQPRRTRTTATFAARGLPGAAPTRVRCLGIHDCDGSDLFPPCLSIRPRLRRPSLAGAVSRGVRQPCLGARRNRSHCNFGATSLDNQAGGELVGLRGAADPWPGRSVEPLLEQIAPRTRQQAVQLTATRSALQRKLRR